MYCIMFNGPPSCGKDTAVDLLKGWINRDISTSFTLGEVKRELPLVTSVTTVKFAAPLKDAVHALMGMPDIPHDSFDKEKDVRLSIFMNKTPRQWYIGISEEFVKKFCGQEFFGDVMVKRIESGFGKPGTMILFSDCGFRDEIMPVLRASKPGDHFLLVQIQRDGCSFKGDSRSWVEREDLMHDLPLIDKDLHWHDRVAQLNIQNNGTIGELFDTLKEKVQEWISYTQTPRS